jgi:hypothetical protein
MSLVGGVVSLLRREKRRKVKRKGQVESEYMGTLSAIPTRGARPVVATSAKRERGKVKGNKRDPRSRVIALDDCKVYKSRDDLEAGKVSHTIARNSGTRKRVARDKAIVEQVHRISSADLPAIANYETDS